MDLKEYDEYTPGERHTIRAHMLTEFEYPWRTGSSLHDSKFTVDSREHNNGLVAMPIYIDPGLMEDRAYQRLSIAAKLAWFALIFGRKQILEVSAALPSGKRPDFLKPTDLDQTILIASMATVVGHVLRGDEFYKAVDEITHAGLIDVDAKGQFSFPRYVRFEQPEGETVQDVTAG